MWKWFFSLLCVLDRLVAFVNLNGKLVMRIWRMLAMWRYLLWNSVAWSLLIEFDMEGGEIMACATHDFIPTHRNHRECHRNSQRDGIDSWRSSMEWQESETRRELPTFWNTFFFSVGTEWNTDGNWTSVHWKCASVKGVIRSYCLSAPNRTPHVYTRIWSCIEYICRK